MRYLFLTFLFTTVSLAATHAQYKIREGRLHDRGSATVTMLSDPEHLKVEMKYDVHKKSFVPVPGKFLKGKKVMMFPTAFKSEAGYKDLETKKTMEIPKALLKFKKRADIGNLKNAYFIEVLPVNKKSKIDIVYHPSLPSLGWYEVDITLLSKIPIVDGYEIEAILKE